MTTTTVPRNAPDALLLGFARALRAAGLPVTADREAGYLQSVAVVGLDDEVATYWAGSGHPVQQSRTTSPATTRSSPRGSPTGSPARRESARRPRR